jgi:hypothetical protein
MLEVNVGPTLGDPVDLEDEVDERDDEPAEDE